MAEEISVRLLANFGSYLATTGRRSSEVRHSNASAAFYKHVLLSIRKHEVN
jgi:hypothetical protein